MAYKQEPCPLCGRDMTAIETYPGRGELYCGHCDLTIGGNDAKTPEELIALMDSSEHRRLKAENDKLRELLGDVGHTLFSLDVDYCGACKADNINHQCPVYTVDGGECLYKTAMRELGVDDV